MKYVIHKVRTAGTSFLVHIVFPDKLVHSEVAARQATTLRSHWRGANVTVHSAGSIGLPEFSCYRGSSSLKIPSNKDPNEDDGRTIMFMDRAHFVTTDA